MKDHMQKCPGASVPFLFERTQHIFRIEIDDTAVYAVGGHSIRCHHRHPKQRPVQKAHGDHNLISGKCHYFGSKLSVFRFFGFLCIYDLTHFFRHLLHNIATFLSTLTSADILSYVPQYIIVKM